MVVGWERLPKKYHQMYESVLVFINRINFLQEWWVSVNIVKPLETWPGWGKKVKTHSSIGIAFSSSSLFCDSRIDLCRWSYVKLFGLYMHHDSEVSSHGSRTYLIVVLCSKICKKEEKRKSASRCRYLSIWRFLGIILLRLPRLPWEESSESWCI